MKNRVSEEVEKAVMDLAISETVLGQVWVSNELRKRGMFFPRLVCGGFG